MVIFKRGAIFLCCIRCDPIPPQTSVQRLAHTRNVTTCCWLPYLLIELFYISMPGRAYSHVITKIYRMVRSPHFLRYRATLARSRGALLQTSNRSCHPWSCIFVPFFPWFQAVIWLFLLRKTCEIFRHFSPALSKQLSLRNLVPRASRLPPTFSVDILYFFTSCYWISQSSSKFGQRLLVIKELAVGLEPIRGGDASSFTGSQSSKPLSTEPKSKVYALYKAF